MLCDDMNGGEVYFYMLVSVLEYSRSDTPHSEQADASGEVMSMYYAAAGNCLCLKSLVAFYSRHPILQVMRISVGAVL